MWAMMMSPDLTCLRRSAMAKLPNFAPESVFTENPAIPKLRATAQMRSIDFDDGCVEATMAAKNGHPKRTRTALRSALEHR